MCVRMCVGAKRIVWGCGSVYVRVLVGTSICVLVNTVCLVAVAL